MKHPIIEAIIKKHFPDYTAEYKFHPARKWRADYAIPSESLLIEIEGGVWTRGRHTRGKGYIKDLEKYNAAVLLGYLLLRYTPQQTAELDRDLTTLKKYVF